MNKTEIIDRLKSGNEKFVKSNLSRENIDFSVRKELVNGQDPFAIILSCADSRVIPELAFDAGLGELFVVRVAGNIADTYTAASLEYVVKYVGTQVLIVLSHQNCGAVTAAVSDTDYGYNLNLLLAHIRPAVIASGHNASVNEVAKKNAEITAQELVKRSTIIAEAVNSGRLDIIPAYYHLDTGEVEFLNTDL